MPLILIMCLVLAFAGSPGRATPVLPPLVLEPCHLDRLAEEVLCGVHEVFEDRAAKTGRRLSIQVAVLPALRRSAQPDPLFILAGGPGQGARSLAPAVASYFRQVRRDRAIVLVDLRGTGGSNALSCLAGRDETAAFAQGADLFLGRGRECIEQFDADPRQYTHASALADLDEIRRRLGYARINLWGGSWGTRAALLYAQTYPDSVRAVVLDGAVPFEIGFPGPVAQDAERALDGLLARCGTDAPCAAAFRSPRADLEAVLDRLARSPAQVTVRHPRTGEPVALTITREAVTEIVRVALYLPVDAARLLQVMRHAARGDFGPLLAQYAYSASMAFDDMALGATMSILCSEDMPMAQNPAVAAEAGQTFLGDAYADGWRSRCAQWPIGPPLAVDQGAVSAAPALILSGATDPVTPPRWGEAMARRFRHHQHVIVPGAAHNASFTGCVPELIATFLDRGDASPIDARCANQVPLPPMVTRDSGGRP